MIFAPPLADEGTSRVFSLASLADLKLLRFRRIADQCDRIAVTYPEFTDDEKQAFEKRLNRWYFSCGCEHGAIGTVSVLLYWVARHRQDDVPLIAWRPTASVLGAAIVGKLLGVAYSRFRLASTCHQIETRLARVPEVVR